MLSRDQLLKPKTTTIDVDGGNLIIRAMSAAYAMDLRGKDLQGVEIFQIVADSIVDEDGNLMFTADEVGTFAMSTVTQIIKAVFEFNKLGQKAVDEAVNELKKTDASTMTLRERLEAEGL